MTITYTLDNTIENSEMATVVFPRLILPVPSGVTLQPYQILTPSVGAEETFSYQGRLTFQAAIVKASDSEDGNATMTPLENSTDGDTPSVSSSVIPVFEGDFYQLQVSTSAITAIKTGSTSEPAITIENLPQGSGPPIPVTITWSLDLVPFCTMTPIGLKPAILTLERGLCFMPVSSLKIPPTYEPSVLTSSTSYIPPLSADSVAAKFQIKPEAPELGDSSPRAPQTEDLEPSPAMPQAAAPDTQKIPESVHSEPNPPAGGSTPDTQPGAPGTTADGSIKTEYVFSPLSAAE